MGVDNSRQINLPILDLRFQHRHNPTYISINISISLHLHIKELTLAD